MTEICRDHINKLYGGWMGKIIGVIHGADIEGWTYEKIKSTFGIIEDYPYTFKNFAADDDINGPIFYIRALSDYNYSPDITAEEMGKTVLNYVPDGHGFFWWGGYGISTENTAYNNLKSGIMAPESGSIAQNGRVLAQQIGGQIFSDCWGLVSPGKPELAASLAEKMSSVTHDGEGIYGGKFIAACIASAYNQNDIIKIIEVGLSVIPADSLYAKMANDVIDFYFKYPEDWEKCFKYIKNKYGYQHFEGVCHIIPNSAVIILSLLYGTGDFSKTINICNMCGWDTDCNVGNVGTIVGVINGIQKIDKKWKEQINDFICASSVIGSLNIQTVPQLVTDTARITYKLYDKQADGIFADIFSEDSRDYFHFEYLESTHALRVDNNNVFIKNSDEEKFRGDRALKITATKVANGDKFKLFYKTYYRPDDFDDSRYDPDFSPVVYPGQSFEGFIKLAEDINANVKVRPYVKNRLTEKIVYSGKDFIIANNKWQKIYFDIPDFDNFIIEEIGYEFTSIDGGAWESKYFLNIFLDEMKILPGCKYTIDFDSQIMEKWNAIHQSVSQFTHLRGHWELDNGYLLGTYSGESAETYTGDVKWKDYIFSATMQPLKGDSHQLLFRVQGGVCSYAVGFYKDKLILAKNVNGYSILEETDFMWYNKEYHIIIKVKGNKIFVYVDGELYIEYIDNDSPYLSGCVGFRSSEASKISVKMYSVEEI